MKAKDLKNKTILELRTHIHELRREILNLRFQKSNGQLTSPSKIKESKKTIARLKSFLERKNNA